METGRLGGDIDKIVSFYADDIVSFDAVTALQFKGKAGYRAHWEECMKHCPGPGIFEFHELRIVEAQDSAFAHGLAHSMPRAAGYSAPGPSPPCCNNGGAPTA